MIITIAANLCNFEKWTEKRKTQRKRKELNLFIWHEWYIIIQIDFKLANEAITRTFWMSVHKRIGTIQTGWPISIYDYYTKYLWMLFYTRIGKLKENNRWMAGRAVTDFVILFFLARNYDLLNWRLTLQQQPYPATVFYSAIIALRLRWIIFI